MTSTARTLDDLCDQAVAIEEHDAARAEQIYRHILVARPRHACALINLGRLRHDAGHVSEALTLYRRATKSLEYRAMAFFNLGVAYYDLGERKQALDAWHIAVDLDPEHADAHFNLILAYQERGNELATMRHLRRYRELTGEDSYVLHAGAVVLA